LFFIKKCCLKAESNKKIKQKQLSSGGELLLVYKLFCGCPHISVVFLKEVLANLSELSSGIIVSESKHTAHKSEVSVRQ
jgi:hypothetical protein